MAAANKSRVKVTIREHRIPTPDAKPYIVSLDQTEENAWFCEMGASKVGRLSLKDYTITEFDTPTPNARPIDIRAGPDGNMYFTENAANAVARITPDGTITEFPIPTPNSGPDGMKLGPDGNLWFCEHHAGKVARMTPDGKFTEYGGFPAESKPLSPLFIGNEMWFSDPVGRRIFKMTLDGELRESATPPAGSPRAMAFGPDGNLWFTLTGGNAIGRMSLKGEDIHHFPLPDTSARSLVWVGDELWFTNEQKECVGHIDMAGRLLGEYFPPTPKAGLRAMKLSRDGRLFFSEHYAGQIAELIREG